MLVFDRESIFSFGKIQFLYTWEYFAKLREPWSWRKEWLRMNQDVNFLFNQLHVEHVEVFGLAVKLLNFQASVILWSGHQQRRKTQLTNWERNVVSIAEIGSNSELWIHWVYSTELRRYFALGVITYTSLYFCQVFDFPFWVFVGLLLLLL